MRGYLNFLLVFASVFLILSLIQASLATYNISFSKAIAQERVYQTQMNFKEVAKEAIRQGSIKGFELYNSSHRVSACDPRLGGRANPFCFRNEEAQLWTRAGAYTYLSLIDTNSFDPEMDLDIYCLPVISDDIARRMANAKKLASDPCPSCEQFKNFGLNITELVEQESAKVPLVNNEPDYLKITGPYCMAIIYPHLKHDPTNINKPFKEMTNPELEKIEIQGPIVNSLYYETFDISSVSYIPYGEVLYP